MIDEPNTPALPEDCPTQPSPFQLPLRPQGFQGYCEWVGGMGLPAHLAPKGSPRNVMYLGTLEWAWSPYHSRVCAYHLGRRGPYWTLWSQWEDDNQIPWKWRWSLVGHSVGKCADPLTAAYYLLMDVWAAEKTNDMDKYHGISDVGVFSVEQLEAIAAVVWPESTRFFTE